MIGVFIWRGMGVPYLNSGGLVGLAVALAGGVGFDVPSLVAGGWARVCVAMQGCWPVG